MDIDFNCAKKFDVTIDFKHVQSDKTDINYTFINDKGVILHTKLAVLTYVCLQEMKKTYENVPDFVLLQELARTIEETAINNVFEDYLD